MAVRYGLRKRTTKMKILLITLILAAICTQQTQAFGPFGNLFDSAGKVVSDIGKGAGEFVGDVGKGATGILGNIGKGATGFVGNIGNFAGKLVGDVEKGASDIGKGASGFIWNLGKGASGLLGDIGAGAGGIIKDIGKGASGLVGDVGNLGSQIVGGVGKGVGGVIGQLTGNRGKSASNVIGSAGAGAGGIIGDIGKGASGFLGSTGNIGGQLVGDIGKGVSDIVGDVGTGVSGLVGGAGNIGGQVVRDISNHDVGRGASESFDNVDATDGQLGHRDEGDAGIEGSIGEGANRFMDNLGNIRGQSPEQRGEGVTGFVSDIGEDVSDFVGDVGKLESKLVGDVGKGVSSIVGEIGNSGGLVGDIGKGASGFIGNVGAGASEILGELGNSKAQLVGGLGRGASEIIGDLGRSVGGNIGKFADGDHDSIAQYLGIPHEAKGCDSDITLDFRKTLYDFATKLFKGVAKYNNHHFVLSPYTVWLALSAFAEGVYGPARYELFNALNLPEEDCHRLKYYMMANNLEKPGKDVTFARKRIIVFDERLKVNESWAESVITSKLISAISGPIRSNPDLLAQQMRDYFGLQLPNPNFYGSSVLFESLDFEGLWTTAFPEASVEVGPFYNDAGEKIGSVEYMKIKKRVKLAHLPMLDAKVLQLPIGKNERYTLFLAINIGKNTIQMSTEKFMNTIILDILENMRESIIPLEVVIPKFIQSSEFDLRTILEEIGVQRLFRDPAATRYISDPPALPSGVHQRVTIKFDTHGVHKSKEDEPKNALEAAVSELADLATGLAAAVGRDFIANRPFLYGLFDSETSTCLLAGTFSKPYLE